MLRFAWEFLLLGKCGKAIGFEKENTSGYADLMADFAAAYLTAKIFALGRFALQ